jgi:hypothetical protein
MPGLAPGAAAVIGLGVGHRKESRENIGVGNAGGRVIRFNISGTTGK